MTYQERLSVNAAIETLLNLPVQSESWIEPARTILELGRTIQKDWAIQLSGESSQNRSDSVSGFTAEAGTISVDDSECEKTTEFFLGQKPERIGYYRVSRPRKNMLELTHFWKSQLGTESETEEPPTYYLWFDKEESPLFLERVESKPMFRIPLGIAEIAVAIEVAVVIQSRGSDIGTQRNLWSHCRIDISI